MEAVVASLITAVPAAIVAVATWRNVRKNHTGTIHEKLDRLESKFDHHLEWHLDNEG